MLEVPAFDVILEIRGTDPLGPRELDATAEVVLEALLQNAQFVAMGPVGSADYARNVIEVECTVTGDSGEDVHDKIGHILQVMLAAANSFEYQSTTTRRLEPVLA